MPTPSPILAVGEARNAGFASRADISWTPPKWEASCSPRECRVRLARELHDSSPVPCLAKVGSARTGRRRQEAQDASRRSCRGLMVRS